MPVSTLPPTPPPTPPAPTPGSYRAAVLEFAPQKWYNLENISDMAAAKQLKLDNFNEMSSYARDAKNQGARIIVFPEYGFTGDNQGDLSFDRQNAQPYLEEIPDVGTVPCDLADQWSGSPAIVKSSCLAMELQMYLVININTREPCVGASDCPDDGMKIHNTAMAFDEGGVLLQVYHKVHPWLAEKGLVDPGNKSMRLQQFRTNFGADIGLFVCFDILFDTDLEVPTDIAYPTDWENDVGIQGEPVSARNTQRTFLFLNGNNVLAANYGGNGRQSSGSGLWHKGLARASFFNPSSAPQTKLLVADMPIIRKAQAVV